MKDFVNCEVFLYNDAMDIPIYETENFKVFAVARPFIDRNEGGHILIFPKVPVRDRSRLSPALAIEYTKISIAAGEALTSAMSRQGVDIGLVNYQDMGNWGVFKPEGPTLHMHIYGRATSATVQKYGDAVQLPHRETGFYDNFEPLNHDDINEIRTDIEKLMHSDKYKDPWNES
jgi:diadenosine tetraphosphate (Ap4A) HIT family hydrolase